MATFEEISASLAHHETFVIFAETLFAPLVRPRADKPHSLLVENDLDGRLHRASHVRLEVRAGTLPGAGSCTP